MHTLRLRSHRQALGMLDALQNCHLFQYSLLNQGNLVKYKIVN